MALQESTRWSIDINRDTSTSLTSKPAVQARLEGYKSPSPISKENISSKISSANTKKTKILGEKIEKSNKKIVEFGERRKRLSGEFDAKVDLMKVELSLKESKAEEKAKNIEAARVANVAAHNAKVAEAAKQANMASSARVEELEKLNADKEFRASMSAKALEAEKVASLQNYNSKVSLSGKSALKSAAQQAEALKAENLAKEQKALETAKFFEESKVKGLMKRNAAVQEKGSAAAVERGKKLEQLKIEADSRNLSASVQHATLEASKTAVVASHNRLVAEKAALAKIEESARVAEAEATICARMHFANESYENEMMSIVVQAASHNDMVASRSNLVNATKHMISDGMKTEMAYKEKSAELARQEIQMERVMALSRKNQEVHERGSAVKQSREASMKMEKEEGEARMLGSSLRRDSFLAEKVSKAKSGRSPDRSAEVSPSKTGGLHLAAALSAESIEQKLSEAAIRRSAIIEQMISKASSFSSPAPKASSKPPSPCKSPVSAANSPTKLPLTMDAINAKQNDAAARRESLLLQRSESAGLQVQKAKEIASSKKGSSPMKSGAIGADGLEIFGKKLHTDEEGLESGHEVREIEEDEEVIEIDMSVVESGPLEGQPNVANVVGAEDVSVELKHFNQGDDVESPLNESQNEDLGGGKCTAA